jgi:hypothetical protein
MGDEYRRLGFAYYTQEDGFVGQKLTHYDRQLGVIDSRSALTYLEKRKYFSKDLRAGSLLTTDNLRARRIPSIPKGCLFLSFELNRVSYLNLSVGDSMVFFTDGNRYPKKGAVAICMLDSINASMYSVGIIGPHPTKTSPIPIKKSVPAVVFSYDQR